MKNKLRGSLALAFATIIWGSAFIAQSVGMDYIGPITFQAARCGLGAIFLLPVIFIFDQDKKSYFKKWADPKLWKTGFFCGCALFVAADLQQVGLVYTTAGKAGFITAMYIVLVPILGLAFRKKPPVTIWFSVLLAVIGLLITAVLHIKKVSGSILVGIVATWGLGMICQLAGIYVPNPEVGAYSLFPSGIMSADFSALGLTLGQCFNFDFSAVGMFNFIVIVFSFLFVDLFDTLGTLIGVSTKANMLDENGRLPKIKPALLSDAIATTAGAVLGTSTTTTFVESAAGVAVGGRTGLTAMTTAILFLLATLFSPLFTSIPSFATAPALIFVGFLMFEAVADLKFTDDNLAEVIPAYLCIIAMPLFYSISEGICIGVISYVVIKALTGKAKDVTPLMYVLAILFVLKYVFL